MFDTISVTSGTTCSVAGAGPCDEFVRVKNTVSCVLKDVDVSATIDQFETLVDLAWRDYRRYGDDYRGLKRLSRYIAMIRSDKAKSHGHRSLLR